MSDAHPAPPTLVMDGEELAPEIVVQGNQPAQAAFLVDTAPGWTCFQGGWGTGKTYIGARKFLALHLYNECPGLVVAPTYEALWMLCVPELERVCLEWGLDFQIFANGRGKDKKPHIMVEGLPIWLYSAEEPKAIAGFEVGHIWGDEAARWPASRSDPLRNALLQVRGRLRHKRAKVLHGLLTTTPEGTDTPIEREFACEKTRKPGHRIYIGSSRLNTALPGQYLTDLMGAVPAELVDQYLDGKAVNYIANRAHPTFTRAANVGEVPWRDALPLHIGCDYNVSPMTWVAAYLLPNDRVEVVDEMVIEDFGQVDAAVHACHARGWGKTPAGEPRFVVFHPDKSSKSRSTVGDPEFVVMTRVAGQLGWNYSGHSAGVNPPIDQRINHLSRLVRDAIGTCRLKVDPRCTRLIDDLERTGRGSNGYDPGSEGKRGHILDALGYLVWDVVEPFGPASAGTF